MDYSFQVQMRDRKNMTVMKPRDIYVRTQPNSYMEKFKQEQKQRQKPSKEKQNRRFFGSEEDLVKTGSEDEDELDLAKQLELARKARPKRAERRKQILKEELINSKQRKNHTKEIENKRDIYKPRIRTTDGINQNKNKTSVSPASNKSYPLRNIPNQSLIYTSGNSGELHFSPKFFDMYQVQENIGFNNDSPITMKIRTDNDTPITMKIRTDSSATNSDEFREEARSKRSSILNRAEKLIDHISRSDRYSSASRSDANETRHKRKVKNKNISDAKYLEKKETSSSDDDEQKYVLVNTTVSPEPAEIAEPDLPRFIQTRSNNSPGQSEIPVEFSDEEDFQPGARPATEVFMSQKHDQRRYEPVVTTAKKEDIKKGRRVTFFRNGDTKFKGLSISICQSDFKNFEALIVFLNDKIDTTSGVRYIFALSDGKEIKSVTEFKRGECYLVSSVKKPDLKLQYGTSRDWTNKQLSGGKVRKDDSRLYRGPHSPTNSPTRKARVITVENNSRKELREKVIINPQTSQNFEDILSIIGDLINMEVDTLYTRRKPYKKVRSFSELFRDFKNHDMFIACQEGEEPTDRSSYNSSSNSDKLQSIDELDMSGSSRSGSPAENGYLSNRSYDLDDDAVSVMINGKTRRYYPPSTTYADEDGGKPDRKLKLEWIYGFHPKENCSNLFVLLNGEIAYSVSAVVVLYKYIRNKDRDKPTKGGRDSPRERDDTQRQYLGHTEEICCMALHPNNRWIASGQLAGKENKAHIRVWDVKLLTTFNVIGVGFFDHGILSINFSQQSTGSFLCVMDDAEKHSLSIWDWQKERMVAKTTTSTLPVKAAVFYKYNDTILITYGQQHIYFWKLFWDPIREKEGRIMRDKRSGLFVGQVPNEILSISFSAKGDVLTGDSSGTVTVWSPDVEYIFSINQDLSESMRNAHKFPVTSLCMLNDNTLMTGGGLEIRAWDSINGYRPANARILPEATGHVREIIPQHANSVDGRLFIGTSKGHVLDGSLQDKFRFVIRGHNDEIWAIAPHPNDHAFFTTSFDKTVIRWNAAKHKIDWKSPLGKPGCCLSCDMKGRQVAVGTQTGQVEILNAYNGIHIASVDISKYRVDCVSFSPDGTKIAAGTHDGLIYILDVRDSSLGYSPSKPLQGHPTFVTHIDWTGDSKYIQSTDGQYNMINWDEDKRCKINDPRVVRDADWHNYSCTTGFPVTGPWTNLENNTYINAVHRSNYRDCLVVGDSTGRVRLYKYPSIKTKPEYRGVKLHTNDVTAVSFLYDDVNVVTAGGSTPVLAQWSVVDALVST